MKYSKRHAIRSLYPDVRAFHVEENGNVTYTVARDKNPTESQISAEITRLDNAEPARLLRVERDKRLAACDWRASSDLTISDAWKTYRQQLRDLPTSSTPKLNAGFILDLTSVTWPTEPGG